MAQEYPNPQALQGTASKFFIIPNSIITSFDLPENRAAIFSYFSVRRGLDNIVVYSVNDIVRSLGKNPDRHKNGINSRTQKVIDYLIDEKYLLPLRDNMNPFCKSAELNSEKLTQDCLIQRFAVIYLDEMQHIFQNKKLSSDNKCLDNDILLLVFAYLRMKIYRRRNRLFPEENNIGNKNDLQFDIEDRRKRVPEVYDCFYKEIAEDIGISERTIPRAISTLKELGLIYYEPLPRSRYLDGRIERWRTNQTLFCNMYKRENSKLLATGAEYYLVEIENKKKKLRGLVA